MLFTALFLAVSARALTIQEIEETPNLTPQSFARLFSAFEFRFHSEIQPPDRFLASRSGDCDDYSILAAQILKAKGYTPRLIAVRMPHVVHVVCYIDETNAYLDYNNRSRGPVTVTSRPEIQEIARSVAKSYDARWTSASEFIFDGKAKRLVRTVLEKERQLASLAR